MVGGKEWKESCLFFDFVFIKCLQKNKLSADVTQPGRVLVLKIGLYTEHGCWESQCWRQSKGTIWHHFQ